MLPDKTTRHDRTIISYIFPARTITIPMEPSSITKYLRVNMLRNLPISLLPPSPSTIFLIK